MKTANTGSCVTYIKKKTNICMDSQDLTYTRFPLFFYIPYQIDCVQNISHRYWELRSIYHPVNTSFQIVINGSTYFEYTATDKDSSDYIRTIPFTPALPIKSIPWCQVDIKVSGSSYFVVEYSILSPQQQTYFDTYERYHVQSNGPDSRMFLIRNGVVANWHMRGIYVSEQNSSRMSREQVKAIADHSRSEYIKTLGNDPTWDREIKYILGDS